MTQTPLWTPSPARVAASQVMDFMARANARHGLALADYRALHGWSVAAPEDVLGADLGLLRRHRREGRASA